MSGNTRSCRVKCRSWANQMHDRNKAHGVYLVSWARILRDVRNGKGKPLFTNGVLGRIEGVAFVEAK